MIPEEFVIG